MIVRGHHDRLNHFNATPASAHFRTAERTNSIGESEMLQHGSPNRTVSAFAKIYPKIPEKYGFYQQTPNVFLIFLPDNSGPGPVWMVVLSLGTVQLQL